MHFLLPYRMSRQKTCEGGSHLIKTHWGGWLATLAKTVLQTFTFQAISKNFTDNSGGSGHPNGMLRVVTEPLEKIFIRLFGWTIGNIKINSHLWRAEVINCSSLLTRVLVKQALEHWTKSLTGLLN